MKIKLPNLPKVEKKDTADKAVKEPKAPKTPKAPKAKKTKKENAFIKKITAFWDKFGFGVSISKRIILTFSLVMVGFAAVLLFLLVRTVDFSNQYNGLLENTFYLNDIKTKTNKLATPTPANRHCEAKFVQSPPRRLKS